MTYTCETVSNDSGVFGVGTSRTFAGLLIRSTSPFVTMQMTKLKFPLAADGTASGTMQAVVLNSGGTVLATSTTTLNAASITGYPTFTDYEFEFSSAIELNFNYYIGVILTGSSADVYPKVCSPSELSTQYAAHGTGTAPYTMTNETTKNTQVCVDATAVATASPRLPPAPIVVHF
jgi:hypothetical protein